MKQSTADILDESKRLDDQIKWQLFTMDQDAQLWGESDVKWKPGDPLGDYSVLSGYEGNAEHWIPHNQDTTRPIYQLIDDITNVKEYYNYYNRCRTCKTWWAGTKPCWVCGVYSPPMTDAWRRLNYICVCNGLVKSEEEIDQMLIEATERAERARQERRKKVLEMSKNISKAAQEAGRSIQRFGDHAANVMVDFETVGFVGSEGFRIMEYGITHEPDGDETRDRRRDAWRRAQLEMYRMAMVNGVVHINWPRQSGRRSFESLVVDEWIRPTPFSRSRFFDPIGEAIKKKPFKMPELLPLYIPSEKYELEVLPRRTRILISRYAFGQVPKPAPIKEPIINRPNYELERWLRQNNQHPEQQRREREVRSPRGRRDADPSRVRQRRGGRAR